MVTLLSPDHFPDSSASYRPAIPSCVTSLCGGTFGFGGERGSLGGDPPAPAVAEGVACVVVAATLLILAPPLPYNCIFSSAIVSVRSPPGPSTALNSRKDCSRVKTKSTAPNPLANSLNVAVPLRSSSMNPISLDDPTRLRRSSPRSHARSPSGPTSRPGKGGVSRGRRRPPLGGVALLPTGGEGAPLDSALGAAEVDARAVGGARAALAAGVVLLVGGFCSCGGCFRALPCTKVPCSGGEVRKGAAGCSSSVQPVDGSRGEKGGLFMAGSVALQQALIKPFLSAQGEHEHLL